MDEEKPKKEVKKEDKPTEDTGEGDKYETTPLIERARQEREKLEAANKETKELLDRQEAIMAKKELGGTTEAGVAVEKKEETPVEYMKKVMANEL